MNTDEKKIRRAFKEKNWNAIKTSDSWQIFKIKEDARIWRYGLHSWELGIQFTDKP